MAELMKQVAVAISAVGSMLYESRACGVPAISYVSAENQASSAETISAKELILSASEIRDNPSFEQIDF